MQVRTTEIPELGNRTHLVHDGRHALVVDPPRDIAPIEAAAEEAGVEITAVADTHVHNDYVSGALALARRHGADYLLSADE
ncbi:MBL fold metallo-hydrolase, partial [Nocardioides hankookensis]